MAVMRKRNRLVSFRLSEEEYEALQNFTVNEGARSISDFARATLCGALDGGVTQAGNGLRVRENTEAAASFNQTLERLVTTMGELNRVIKHLSVLVESNSQNGERR